MQRTVTIVPYDVSTTGPQFAVLNVAAVRAAIQRAVPGSRYYSTVHHKWHKGYNPFFLIV